MARRQRRAALQERQQHVNNCVLYNNVCRFLTPANLHKTLGEPLPWVWLKYVCIDILFDDVIKLVHVHAGV